MLIELKVIHPEMRAHLPAYQTSGSAGLDLRASLAAPIRIEPGGSFLVPTGIAIHIADPAYAGLIIPRSGLGFRHGIVLANLVGLIDSDYQGQLIVPLWNRSAERFMIHPMDRIAQMIVVPVVQATLKLVDAFPASARGEGGFGSTGR